MRARARRIRWVLMDVDGVLTDGGIVYVGSRSEGRVFDVKDGVGIWLLRRGGLRTGVISGRSSIAVRRRARELGMEEVHLRVRNKLRVYEEILRRRRISDDEVCFIGDDVVDIPVLARVGMPIAVADAHPEAKRVARFVTRASGGRGAVREIADIILSSQGKMGDLLRRLGEISK